MTNPHVRIDELQLHSDFVRRLARRLVADEHAAEDLAQDAHLAALRGAPSDPEQQRAWFVRVLWNLASNLRRGQYRRAERERVAARSEVVDASDVGENMELQRRLVSVVAELDEPYRTAIYLRFYQNLMPREIAARQRVSVYTVKTRLQRAMQRIREALDEQPGVRSDWRALFVPTAPATRALSTTSSIGLSVPALGGIALKTKALVGVALLSVATLVAVGLFNLNGSGPEPDPIAEAAGAGGSQTAQTSGAVSSEEVGSRQSIPDAPSAKPETPESTETGDWILSGRVTDESGDAISGAEVTAVLETQTRGRGARTDGHGRYRIALHLPSGISAGAPLSAQVSAAAAHHTTGTRSCRPLRGADETGRKIVLDFQLARQPRVIGTLVDEKGVPAQDATVVLLDARGRRCGSSASDRHGRFEIPATDVREVWVAAGSAGHGRAVAGPFASTDTRDVDAGTITLVAAAKLAGRVSYPDGRGIAGVVVNARLLGVPVGGGAVLESWSDDEDRPEAPPTALAGSSKGEIRTDGEGHFEFRGLAPGLYELEAMPLSRLGQARSVGQFKTGTFAALVLDSYRVRITVTDERGFAVPGAEVTAEAREGVATIRRCEGADASCTFRVGPGSWTFTASLEGAAPVRRSLEVFEKRFEYELSLPVDFNPAVGDLSIVATDETGRRLRAFELYLWREDRDSLAPDIRGLRPDAEGVVRAVPIGRYRMRVMFSAESDAGSRHGLAPHMGHHFGEEAFATIEEGKRTTIRIGARRGGRLRLLVGPTFEGKGLSGVELELHDGAGGKRRISELISVSEEGVRTVRAALGRAGFSGLLEPGVYTLRASASGFETFEREVEVKPMGVAEVRIEFVAR